MNIIGRLAQRWRALDSAWRFALGAYLAARVALSAWAFVIALLFPIIVRNLDLFGAPTLAVFDLSSGERYAYSRVIGDATLAFRSGDPGFVIDEQTNSVWSLRDGRAITGTLAGRAFGTAAYSVEEIYPYHGVAPEKNLWLSVWQRFDANWYLAIAARGYAADDGSTVYFPLFPGLIHIVSFFTDDAMFAALLVSNLASIGALAFLFRLSEEFFDGDVARRSIVYWLLFPTGFFLLAAYTESLFLFLTLGAFVFARQSRWSVAAIFGALAALTRLQGVLLIVPLVWMLLQQARLRFQVSSFKLFARRGFVLLIIPLATLVFLAFTNLSLLASYEGELHARFVMPWDNVLASVALMAGGQGSLTDALNQLATLGFAVMLLALWKKLSREYGLYSLTMFFAPLFRMTTTQPLVSMDRYVVALFPVFMLWGAWGKNSWVNRLVVYLSFPLQLYLSAQFVLWGWVG